MSTTVCENDIKLMTVRIKENKIFFIKKENRVYILVQLFISQEVVLIPQVIFLK
jgi:hypothetical protein